MAAQDLSPVGAAGFGGAVGVEGELPALPVNADIMVILAHECAIPDRCLAAVLLVAQVVDVAIGGGAVAPGPGAVPVAELDGAADVGGDRAAAADVEGEAASVS